MRFPLIWLRTCASVGLIRPGKLIATDHLNSIVEFNLLSTAIRILLVGMLLIRVVEKNGAAMASEMICILMDLMELSYGQVWTW